MLAAGKSSLVEAKRPAEIPPPPFKRVWILGKVLLCLKPLPMASIRMPEV